LSPDGRLGSGTTIGLPHGDTPVVNETNPNLAVNFSTHPVSTGRSDCAGLGLTFECHEPTNYTHRLNPFSKAHPRIHRLQSRNHRTEVTMKAIICLMLLVSGFASTPFLIAAEPPSLAPQLEPLRPLLEKTWKGTFENSKPENPVVDVMKWERALNGKAIRVLHSINDGAYGGETIYRWDEQKKAVTYHYFTTAGFMTTGTMTFKDNKLISHELITGTAGGTAEVRGTSELTKDGELKVKTEHLKEGKWQPGHAVTYKLVPDAKVVFK
jgi:hypothetical protein